MARTVLVTSLSTVLVSLLLVGLVSGTVLRHCVQVLPAAMAIHLAVRRVRWASGASLPIFVIWFGIMLLIWLYLLGLARVVTGRFSPAEIAFTIVIGLACAWGISAATAMRHGASLWSQLGAAAVFAALQITAIWASMLPMVANR
jgi:hypothetical protein